MLRRTLLLAVASTLAVVPRAWGATPIRIWGLWTLDPTPGRNGINQHKGTLKFRVNNDTTDRTLNTYGNGTAATSSERQCVELIKRYAAKLGFVGYTAALGAADNGNNLPSLGDGYQAAGNFAGKSDGGFVYVANGSASLPKAGAVVSIAEFIPGGHVGIICNHDAPTSTTTTVSIKLFEQNMPIDTWKEIRFRKSGGKWFGQMSNKGTYYDVVGWANPTG
jgi:hypothetical protein